MTEIQFAERAATIDTSLADIDRKIIALEEKRSTHSLSAVEGNVTALKAIAAADAEVDKLNRDKRTLVVAREALERQELAAKQAAAAKEARERTAKAQALGRNACAANARIDDLLDQLAAACEQRMSALRELTSLDVIDRGVMGRLLGKGPLTAALHHAGLHRHCALMTGAPTSARPMAGANNVLSFDKVAA
jgi:hypothetical protein